MFNMFKRKQYIGCDVDSCKYCDCKNNECLLNSIDVKYQLGHKGDTCKEGTVCGSYECKKNCK